MIAVIGNNTGGNYFYESNIFTKVIYMKTNLGNLDKAIRVLLAAAFAVLFVTGKISGITGIILVIAGGIFLATSVIGFCPIYSLFGIKTCKAGHDKV
jgi:hypothetical protein